MNIGISKLQRLDDFNATSSRYQAMPAVDVAELTPDITIEFKLNNRHNNNI